MAVPGELRSRQVKFSMIWHEGCVQFQLPGGIRMQKIARFAGASIGQSKSIRRRRIPGHNDWESEGLWSDYSLSEAIPTSPIAKHLRNTSTSLIESLFFTFRRLLWQQCYKPTCAV
ncbi:hypothetical protein CISG_09917 [Coccidioides immitis RMSCC 3703]|uniref:Uncharacterized protein n=2 Tax=Coccidioides immitis TaxID=5501 RepID=A0A0J8QP25_COCIT|nr:hypothetical protein CIRG_08246 [Coccidioides immitis RMSCC 2394]KMU73038.1 hypothetical protein CISG_09917 [Coccidioides immitis RMSCC 3703]